MTRSIYGAVSVRGKSYDDEEIAALVGTKIGPYGAGWRFQGDQSWEESNIFIDDYDGKGGGITFDGRDALPEALSFLKALPV